MWRHNLRAFARWGLRQRPPGQQAEHAERLVASPAEDRRGDRDDRRKETCHEEGRCFTRRPECRFAEAVGWVGLAVGLNVQLHSRLWRNNNDRPEETSRKAGLCGLLQSVVFRLASASPAVKSVLPESGAAAETASPRSPDEEMSSALREYLSLLEECEAARLLARGDTAGSIACFQRAPDSARAHYNLGICYQDGRGGLAPDRNKALEHYREAALRGHPMATYNLGLLLHQQQDHRGLQLLQTAADLGVAQAQAFVGYVRLQEGRFSEAVGLLSRAAQAQDADALFYLGLCSERGLGVPKDPGHALRQYSRAAHGGHAGAREAIARLAPEPTKAAWGDALSAGPQLCPAQ
ncbi:conserved hypothetical protein [Ixodes scapularis]|uniref:Death ligand signal enhancer n=1 Tax=Ixodes scapularis TaxID=6945 RepID=B7PGP9_IXOSC|nr:conserved hypothetical protein [Ixodes scapularis]|eukprot:XP_002401229.1 conserved hypothetical protein [Ixodes scapularis]